MSEAQVLEKQPLDAEEELRSQLYRLLAFFLHKPPDAAGLGIAAQMQGDDTDLGKAIAAFAKIAAKSDPVTITQEFHDLFVGIGRGELLPYGSYYLTGFLHEKPLAKLRNDMTRLGIERRQDVKEPEDHIAALCEMMSGLIAGDFGDAADLERQKQFFTAHVASWAKHFFTDLEAAKSSVLYGALGSVGRCFIEIEEVAFTMD
jgi:TorA maturation chaperone TorD